MLRPKKNPFVCKSYTRGLNFNFFWAGGIVRYEWNDYLRNFLFPKWCDILLETFIFTFWKLISSCSFSFLWKFFNSSLCFTCLLSSCKRKTSMKKFNHILHKLNYKVPVRLVARESNVVKLQNWRRNHRMEDIWKSLLDQTNTDQSYWLFVGVPYSVCLSRPVYLPVSIRHRYLYS